MNQLTATEQSRLVDQQCDRFEAAWNGDDALSIEQMLSGVPETARTDLFAELLALELEFRVRQDPFPKPADYVERFPKYTETIEQTWRCFCAWAESSSRLDEDAKRRLNDTVVDRHAANAETAIHSSPDGDALPNLDRYTIDRELGRGGMGTVYLAHDTALDRTVALKVPHFESRDKAGLHKRFLREARAMATVHHPNLCPIYDVGEFDGRPYLTLAYIDGRTLAEKIKGEGPQELVAAVGLVLKLTSAVQALHEAGVLHRDLKPSNVMIDKSGEPFLTDFGLAQRDDLNEAELTQSGVVIGSPAYMAPEQLRGDRESIGPATDIYALGLVLYETVCGRYPSGTLFDPPTMSDLDWELAAICRRAIASDPAARFVSCTEFAKALRGYLAGQPDFAVDRNPKRKRGTESVVIPRSRFGLGRPTTYAFATAIACLAVALTYLLISQKAPSTTAPAVSSETAGSVLSSPHGEVARVEGDGTQVAEPIETETRPLHFIRSTQPMERTHTTELATGDFDGDGDIDVFAAATGATQFWRNDGNGWFEITTRRMATPWGGAALGDLEGDSDLDLFLANSTGSDRVYWNDGNGDFVDSGHLLNEGAPLLRQIRLADLDSDNDLDVFVVNKGRDFVLLNDGSGNFERSGQEFEPNDSHEVRIGDLDGDGDLDAVIAGVGANRVWLNDGDVRFRITDQELGNHHTKGCALSDVDGDGDLDLVCANLHWKPDRLWLNDGTARFSDGGTIGGEFHSNDAAFADVDNDGDLDLVIANFAEGKEPDPPYPTYLWLNDGRGHFEEQIPLTDGLSHTTSIAIEDIDSDGDLDILLGNWNQEEDVIMFNQLESRAMHPD